ncbi:hypothetical protein PISL3812_03876 [Talaromyces islandicus]|uniref:Protein ARV n=1 Tax=Talaromyces islandicus TaxID=28573 RepID=A0A0U1LTZ6_TALIS|nr:hypothetical protein PISL3812_03876 [Talaromyces islandicus]
MNPYEASPDRIPPNDLYADVPLYGRYFPRPDDFRVDLQHVNSHTPDAIRYWTSVVALCREAVRIYPADEGSRDVFALGTTIVKSSHLHESLEKDYSYADANEVRAIGIAKAVFGDTIRIPDIYFSGKINGRSVLVQERLPGVTMGVAWPYLSETQRESFKEQTRELLQKLHRIKPNDKHQVRSHIVPDPNILSNGGLNPLEAKILFSDSNTDSDLRFMHNDVTQSNIIVDNDKIVGLIDWEMAGFFGWKTAGEVHRKIRTPQREHFVNANLSEETLRDMIFWNDLYDVIEVRGKADDRALGKGVRLTQCPRCKRFADKYVEHDNVVLFIDLVLIKPQVYRHLLFNRLGRDDNKFDRSIIRLGVLLLLFDVYLTWARIEKSSTLSSTALSNAPIIIQYLFFLTLNALATLSHHLVVRLGASLMPRKLDPSLEPSDATNDTPTTPAATTSGSNTLSQSPSSHDILQRPPSPVSGSGSLPPSYWPPDNVPPPGQQAPSRRVSTAFLQMQPLLPPPPPSANAVSTALFVSSCPKLFPILLVIWGSKEGANPDEGSSATDSPVATMIHEAVKTATSSILSQPATSLEGAAASLVSSDRDAVISKQTNTMPFSELLASLATFISTFDLHSLLSFFSLGAANTHWVLLNNIEALYILLNCGYLRAVALAVAGQLARWIVEKTILGLFGIR